MYAWIKLIHVTTISLSITLFVCRGLWGLAGPGRPLWRWMRIAPHIIDTLLLASGLTLAFLIHQLPFVNSGWLTAKVIGLILYIILGMVALHSSRSRSRQWGAWFAALVVFGYIVSVAVTKQPAGFLALVYG